MKLTAFFLVTGWSVSVFAQVAVQPSGLPDSAAWQSAREVSLPPIDVSSTRDGILRKAYSFSQPYLIQTSDTRTEPLTNVLSRSPGLEIKDYGGNGGLKTVSARGTSASQNLVVLDGMVVNDALTGSANLSLLSAENLDQIAVQTGGFSADVANGGLGSTIYLNTTQATETKSQFQSSAGSFGTRSWKGSQHLKSGAFSGFFSLSSDWTEGNYRLPSGGTRTNQDFSGRSGFGTLTFKTANTESALSLHLSRQEQGVPGPVFMDNPNFSTARLASEDLRIIPTVSLMTASGLFRTSALIRSQNLTYTDSSLPSGKSDFREQEVSLRTDFLTESIENQWNTGLYLRRNQSQADSWRGKTETDRLERSSLAVFSTKTFTFSESTLKVQLNGRFEGGRNLPATGSGSLSVSGQPGLFITSFTFNRNIRYPSLNEIRLTSSGGNHLVSEKFAGFDADVTLPFSSGMIRLKSFFYVIQDKIISIPKNPVVWSSINAGQVQGSGFEQSAEWQVQSFSFHQFLTLQSVISLNGISSQADGKQLIYTPQITAGASLNWTRNNWELNTHWRYTGIRNASVENLKSDQLPAFILGDFSVSKKIIFPVISLTADFQVKNLTDQSFEWVMAYPMPGRSFLMTLTLETNP